MTPSEIALSLVSLGFAIYLVFCRMEKWVKIEGYRNYEVSESGKIRTKDYNHTGKSKLLSVFKNSYGYMAVNLMQDGERHRKLVHRLVAMAFKKESWFPMATVNHIDLNKENNHYCNLEWLTVSENLKHGHVNGAVNYSAGENHYASRLSTEKIRDMRYQLMLGIKGREVAENFGVSEKYVSAIKTGKSRKYESI